MKKPSLLPGAAGAALFILALALTAGCSSHTQRDMMAEAVTAGEKPVAMKGESTFFDGKVAAFATVSRGFDRGRGEVGKGPGGRGRPDDDIGGGRRRKDSDGITDVYSTGFGDSEEEQKAAMEEYIRQAKARRAQGSPMPPVTLRVGFENKGTEPMTVEVTEVNSDLGNFAVRPDKLTIAPGEKGALEPMISQLGVTSDVIPLKLTVRVAGKKETQVIDVKNIILASVMKP